MSHHYSIMNREQKFSKGSLMRAKESSQTQPRIGSRATISVVSYIKLFLDREGSTMFSMASCKSAPPQTAATVLKALISEKIIHHSQ